MRPIVAAVVLLGALPGIASAHPLGNFTINHYAGIRVSATEIHLDVVIDRAEIPTFQERRRLDVDGDGELSPTEETTARDEGCPALASELELTLDGIALDPELVASGVQFPPGAGGLLTMRLVCTFVAEIPGGLGATQEVTFADRSFPDRLGWREIVAEGDGITVDAAGTALQSSPSRRLTAYPEDMLAAPLAMREARLTVTPGGPSLPPLAVPDAQPLGTGQSPSAGGEATGVVPGGVAADVPAIFRATDLSPAVLLAAIGTALALGAGHALTPGHGKSLMAAYLVGTRGTAIHAVGLGLSVTVSHTLGILALAALVVAAQGVIAPDIVVRWTPLIAALTIIAIGAWMLLTELRRGRRAGSGAVHDPDDAHGWDRHEHEHEHPHEHGHDGGRAHTHEHDELVHRHGPVRHTHAPRAGTTITWRTLFALGLAGGIIPSTSALLILLSTIAAGRPAFGVLLVIAFGLGMALVLGGVGVLLVRGRGVLDRLPRRSALGRLADWAPLAAAVVVLGAGVWLTGQALTGGTSL